MNPITLAKELIKIDTSTSSGKTTECAEYLKDLLSKEGFKCIILKKGKDSNLIATYGKNPEMIFSGHMDTVDPNPKEWKTNPWKPLEKNGKLYGLGSCDMKGPIACIISSVLKNKEKMKKGCKFIFTFDEENGFKGIKSIPKKYLKGKYCIVCEPSNFYPVIAHKGVLRYKLIIYGESAHGSTPWKGVNALDHLIEVRNLIKKLNKKLLNKKNYVLGKPVYNLGILKGGRASNIVPSEAVMEFEFRLIPELNYKNVDGKIHSLITSYCKKNKLKYNFSQDYVTAPFFENKNSKFISKIKSICKNRFLFFNGATEAPLFQSNGAHTLILGPAGGMEHKANEYITLSQLKKGEKIYEKIIRAFC